MGYWTNKEDAYVSYKLVVDELSSYPWKEVGISCWAESVRLYQSPYSSSCITVIWFSKSPSKLPDHVPHPLKLGLITGVHCTDWLGWSLYYNSTPYNCAVLEQWCP